jgi:phosphotriesterase-related protein
MKYGGHGFSHILLHVVPKMLGRGFSRDQVDKITKTNPQTWLTFTGTNQQQLV